MEARIVVVSLKDNQEISFSDLQLFHAGCNPGSLKKNRDPITDTHTLLCDCGFKMDFPVNHIAMREILLTAIDELSRPLPKDSFSCNRGNAVVVVSRSAS